MRHDLLKGHLDAMLLAVVADGPAHGYAIVEALRVRSAGALALSEGTVYPALHRLEEEGLLESRWVTAGGRSRRVYQVTRPGREVLGIKRHEWHEFADVVNAILAGAE